MINEPIFNTEQGKSRHLTARGNPERESIEAERSVRTRTHARGSCHHPGEMFGFGFLYPPGQQKLRNKCGRVPDSAAGDAGGFGWI